MKVLTRYLLRIHIGPFVFAFMALTGVILINTVAKELAKLAGKGLSPSVMFEFFLLSLPANIALALPMAVLVSVLYSFSQMSAEHEIIALKASGIDLRRMVAPLILLALLITGGMIWFNDNVLPQANYRWRMLMMDVAQTSPLVVLREQVMNRIPPDGTANFYLQAREIDPATSRMRDVAIFDVGTPGMSRTIYADSGSMTTDASRTDLMLTLYDGHVREVEVSEPETFQKAEFSRQVIRMEGVSQRLQRTSETSYRSDRDMTIPMMRAELDSLYADKRDVHGQLAAATDEDLEQASAAVARLQQRSASIDTRVREVKVELHKKYAIAVATLVFVLIGVPLSLRFPSGGVGMVIITSLLIFSVYYVGLTSGETLGNRGLAPPALTMWVTNIIFGALGIFGMFWAGRETGSGRSGLWEQIRSSVRLRKQDVEGAP